MNNGADVFGVLFTLFVTYVLYRLAVIIKEGMQENFIAKYYWIVLISVWFLGLLLFFRFDEINHTVEPEGQTILIAGILGFILLPSSIAAGITAAISGSTEIALSSWFVYSFLQAVILGFISNQLRDNTLAMMQLSLPSLELLNALFRILRLII